MEYFETANVYTLTMTFSLNEPRLHDWCNKGRGMCYPVCGMMHVKEPMLLFGKSSPCDGSRFPLSLSEWFFTICMTPYNRKDYSTCHRIIAITIKIIAIIATTTTTIIIIIIIIIII